LQKRLSRTKINLRIEQLVYKYLEEKHCNFEMILKSQMTKLTKLYSMFYMIERMKLNKQLEIKLFNNFTFKKRFKARTNIKIKRYNKKIVMILILRLNLRKEL